MNSSSSDSRKRQTRFAHLGTYVLLSIASFNMYYVLKEKIYGFDRVCVSFSFALLFLGIVFGYIRKSNKFYFASFKEIPDILYWFILHQAYTLASVLRIYLRADISDVLQVIYRVNILFLVFFYLILFQTKPWVSESAENRNKKIKKLFKKARLSKTEISAVVPELVNNARDTQHLPISWQVVKWVTAFILAASLNLVADIVLSLPDGILIFDQFFEIVRVR